MSPEANKPDTQTGSEHFVEGIHPTDRVRPFKQGDLPDVHDDLIERGVPDTVTIHPDTLETDVDKIPLDSMTEKKSSWKKWTAGAIGAAVFAGGGFVAAKSLGNSDSPTPPEREPSVSAPEKPAQPEDVSASIDTLVTTSTPEQMQYVIDNPVSMDKFSDPVDALAELGRYSNVLFLSDPDKTPQETSTALYETIFDANSPAYASTVEGMDERRSYVAAERILFGEELEAYLAFEPTVTEAVQAREGLAVNTNMVYGGNISRFKGSSEKSTTDYNVDFILTNDGTNWKIYAANNQTEMGDVR